MIPKICFFLFFFLMISFCGKSQFFQDSTISNKMNFNTAPAFSLSKVPGNFYAKNMGFFCKQELSIQKFTMLPIKFRLGSVSYCDALEGKNNRHVQAE